MTPHLSPVAAAAHTPGATLAQAALCLERLDHGIRTPLGALFNGIELLRLSCDSANATQSAALAMMERQVREMMTQVGQLADISRQLRGLELPA